jgi:hypothetical protein
MVAENGGEVLWTPLFFCDVSGMTRIPNQFNAPFCIAQIFPSPIRRRIRGCHWARLLLGIGPLDDAECPQASSTWNDNNTNMSFLESLQQLDDLHDSKKTWTTTTVIMNIIDDVSANPRTSTPTNIAGGLGGRRGSRVVAAIRGKRWGVVGGRCSNSFLARSGCCRGCLGPGFGARIGSLGGGGAAATANSSATLVDGLEDNGALVGGAPSGQDLSHQLLSGGWLLTFNWIRQESASGGRHGTSSNGEDRRSDVGGSAGSPQRK